MDLNEKKKIVRASITQASVPVLFDDVVAASEIYSDTLQVTITENGVTTIKAEDIDREEREAQGLTPYDGMSTVEVTVDTPVTNVQASKAVSYAENGEYAVAPDEGYDAVAEVNVTVDVQPVTSFEGIKQFDSIDDMEELNSYDVRGALVSYDSTTGKYTVWNGDSSAAGYWNPDADHRQYSGSEGSPELTMDSGSLWANGWASECVFPDTYGEVIAVCLGSGLWSYIKWDPSNDDSNYIWCKQDGTLWDWQNDCFGFSGAECTARLMGRVTADDESLFWTLKNTGSEDSTQGHLYVPSKYEIIPAIINQGTIIGGPLTLPDYSIDEEHVSYDFTNALSHACRLRNDYYWSSSQGVDSKSSAYSLYYANGLESTNTSNTFRCQVLVRFGAALAAAESDQGTSVG